MPMKTSNLITRIAMGVLLLGVLVYFGVYIYQSCTGGLTTVLAYEDSADVGVKAAGLVVRRERVLSADHSATIDFSPDEGDKVSGGGVVATLYPSSAGLETKKAIQTLEAELEQLQYAKSAAAGPSDAAKTENDLLAAMAGLHASAAAGDLSSLETDVLQLKALVFKRDYTYSGDSQELDSLISRKNDQLNALRASLGVVSTVIRAPEAGVFSAVADGYEELLYPELLEDLTTIQLTGLENRSVSPPPDAIGKIITSSTWYFAASAPTADVKGLIEQRTGPYDPRPQGRRRGRPYFARLLLPLRSGRHHPPAPPDRRDHYPAPYRHPYPALRPPGLEAEREALSHR